MVNTTDNAIKHFENEKNDKYTQSRESEHKNIEINPHHTSKPLSVTRFTKREWLPPHVNLKNL